MYKLYGRRSAGSSAPEMLLAELAVPYEFVPVTREAMKEAEFLRINPRGQIPALALPSGEVVTESAAMLAYLSHVHPSPISPVPGSLEHARFLQWLSFIATNLYESYLRYYYSDRYTAAGAAGAADVKTQALRQLDQHFAVVDAALSPYLAGERLTAADLYLAMFVSWYEPTPAALLARHPEIRRVFEEIAARPRAGEVLRLNA